MQSNECTSRISLKVLVQNNQIEFVSLKKVKFSQREQKLREVFSQFPNKLPRTAILTK